MAVLFYLAFSFIFSINSSDVLAAGGAHYNYDQSLLDHLMSLIPSIVNFLIYGSVIYFGFGKKMNQFFVEEAKRIEALKDQAKISFTQNDLKLKDVLAKLKDMPSEVSKINQEMDHQLSELVKKIEAHTKDQLHQMDLDAKLTAASSRENILRKVCEDFIRGIEVQAVKIVKNSGDVSESLKLKMLSAVKKVNV